MYLFTYNQMCSTNTPIIHGAPHLSGDGSEHSQPAGLTSLLQKTDVTAKEICKHEPRKLKKKIEVFCFEV